MTKPKSYRPKPCVVCERVFQPTTSHMKCCSLECRFWPKVDRSAGDDKCWPWTRAITPSTGYGCFTVVTGEQATAHRLAYELTNGPIPDGLYVLHRCDNRPCCNPAHLFLGTATDNAADMWSKGRQHAYTTMQRGAARHNAVLTPTIVRDIRRQRAAAVTLSSLARQYGVTISVISCAARGKTWKHVT